MKVWQKMLSSSCIFSIRQVRVCKPMRQDMTAFNTLHSLQRNTPWIAYMCIEMKHINRSTAVRKPAS